MKVKRKGGLRFKTTKQVFSQENIKLLYLFVINLYRYVVNHTGGGHCAGPPCISIRTTLKLSRFTFFGQKSESTKLFGFFCLSRLPAPDFQSTSREFLMSRINSLTFSTSERLKNVEKHKKERNCFNLRKHCLKSNKTKPLTSEWFNAKTAIVRLPACGLKTVKSSASDEGTIFPPFKAQVRIFGWKKSNSLFYPEVRSGTHLLDPASAVVFLSQPYWCPTTAPTWW